MRVLYINNDGGGFADYLDVSSNMTVEQFFTEKMPSRKPEDFLIRVNRQPAPRDYVLQENDRVTITPTKVEGAVIAGLAGPRSSRVKGNVRGARYTGRGQCVWGPKSGPNRVLGGNAEPEIYAVGYRWQQQQLLHLGIEERANSITVGLSSNPHWS